MYQLCIGLILGIVLGSVVNVGSTKHPPEKTRVLMEDNTRGTYTRLDAYVGKACYTAIEHHFGHHPVIGSIYIVEGGFVIQIGVEHPIDIADIGHPIHHAMNIYDEGNFPRSLMYYQDAHMSASNTHGAWWDQQAKLASQGFRTSEHGHACAYERSS